MKKTTTGGRAKKPRRKPAPEVTIETEVDRLMDLIRSSPFLTDDRPRAEGIDLVSALESHCMNLLTELLTEQSKHGD